MEFAATEKPGVYRIDMYDCPSKGFLLRNGLENFHDYCDHCMGWVGPMMKDFGYAVDHEHNHCGQCWWEMRKPDPAREVAAPGETSGKRDVRFLKNWSPPGVQVRPLCPSHRSGRQTILGGNSSDPERSS